MAGIKRKSTGASAPDVKAKSKKVKVDKPTTKRETKHDVKPVKKAKNEGAIRALMDLAPKTVTLLRDGRHVEVPAEDIVVGDRFLARPGEGLATDGTIAEATVLKGLGYGLDEEALRVVRQMPAWTPGYQAQHAVAVRFTLPITFKIQ